MQFTKAQVEIIHAFYKEGKSIRCIAKKTGIAVCIAQLSTKKICDVGLGLLLTHRNSPVKTGDFYDFNSVAVMVGLDAPCLLMAFRILESSFLFQGLFLWVGRLSEPCITNFLSKNFGQYGLQFLGSWQYTY